MIRKIRLAVVAAAFGLAAFAEAKTVRYDLTATRAAVNLSGKKTVDWALQINGTIPAPTLEFTEGDDAEITVKNGLADEEVSIHWHGLLLPPEMDGVAYLTTPPIHPGSSYVFKFRLRQHGTFWYHSHTNIQEQKGLYGAFVIHPKKGTIPVDHDIVAVLSDWSDEDAYQIMRNLRKDGDYYLHKKNSIRSYFGALQAGALRTHLANEWSRMGGMDPSDVGYDAFLVNGKVGSQLLMAHPGERVRLRIINAAASTYFTVALGQDPVTVISADGTDIEPVLAKELLMGMAETYDVLFTVPEHKNYEFRATAQDGTGHASAWIGMGEKVEAPDKPRPSLYAGMDHSAHQAHSEHSNHSQHSQHSAPTEHAGHGGSHAHAAVEAQPARSVETLTVDEVRATGSTAFAAEPKRHDIKLVLGGDMGRYVWHINGKAIHEESTITIDEGDIVRFTLENETMMNHPMHLHGHFFRVLTKAGDLSPLKHTVDVPPHGSRTIEFLANEPGEWMLHCHNLYHMKTGMARVLKYSSFAPKPDIARHRMHDPHAHDHMYYDGAVELATNHGRLDLRMSQTWTTLEARAESRVDDDGGTHGEGDVLYRRWYSQYFNLVGGATHFPEHDADKTRAFAGVGWTLPMLIDSNWFLDHHGKARVDFEKRFQWTSTVLSDLDVTLRDGFKPEWELTLMYAPAWSWSAGLTATENKLGAGFRYRF